MIPHHPEIRPTPGEVADWATRLEQRIWETSTGPERAQMKADLLALLGELRQAQQIQETVLWWLVDVVLMAARDLGASWPELAAVYNRNRKKLQVNGPREHLEIVQRNYPTVAALLAHIQAAAPRLTDTDTEEN